MDLPPVPWSPLSSWTWRCRSPGGACGPGRWCACARTPERRPSCCSRSGACGGTGPPLPGSCRRHPGPGPAAEPVPGSGGGGVGRPHGPGLRAFPLGPAAGATPLDALGLCIGLAPFTLLYVLPWTLGAAVPAWAQFLAVVPLLVVPPFFTAALVRYRLDDLGLILRRGSVGGSCAPARWPSMRDRARPALAGEGGCSP